LMNSLDIFFWRAVHHLNTIVSGLVIDKGCRMSERACSTMYQLTCPYCQTPLRHFEIWNHSQRVKAGNCAWSN
jgi:hypothetical protein